MQTECTWNANASVIYANASFFDANAFQMHYKCIAIVFLAVRIHVNASVFDANA